MNGAHRIINWNRKWARACLTLCVTYAHQPCPPFMGGVGEKSESAHRQRHFAPPAFLGETMYKKITIILAVVLMLSLFVPVGANKPGRIQSLEARVKALESKLQGYEMLKLEVSNLESYVNYILSDAYVDWLLSQL